MYAVYSPRDGLVYGLGGTRHEAQEDATANGATLGSTDWNPSEGDLVNARTFGTLIVVPCTEEVANLVETHGGDPSLWPGKGILGVDDGVVSLLLEEE